MNRTTGTRTITIARHLLPLLAVLLLALVATTPRVRAAGDIADVNAVPYRVVPTATAPGGSGPIARVPGSSQVLTQTDTTVIAYCGLAQNVTVDVTETTVLISFGTCHSLRAILNIYREDVSGGFGNTPALDVNPVTQHALGFSGLEPGVAYRYSISDGTGNEIGDGHFAARLPQTANLRVQPGTTTAQVSFDLDVPATTTLVFTAPRVPEVRRDLNRAQHVSFNQTGLKSGTQYTVTVLCQGQFVATAPFKTGVLIDDGPELHGVPD